MTLNGPRTLQNDQRGTQKKSTGFDLARHDSLLQTRQGTCDARSVTEGRAVDRVVTPLIQHHSQRSASNERIGSKESNTQRASADDRQKGLEGGGQTQHCGLGWEKKEGRKGKAC